MELYFIVLSSVFILEIGIVCVFSLVFETIWEISSVLLKLFSFVIIFVSDNDWEL